MKITELKKQSTKTDATAWVILYTSDKVILGKRAPTVNNPHQWNFFGGHVDEGEEPIHAAIRELEEETGYLLYASELKEIATIKGATYFSAKISDAHNIRTTQEISRVKSFKLTDLPDNLHRKTENFFSSLETLLA